MDVLLVMNDHLLRGPKGLQNPQSPSGRENSLRRLRVRGRGEEAAATTAAVAAAVAAVEADEGVTLRLARCGDLA